MFRLLNKGSINEGNDSFVVGIKMCTPNDVEGFDYSDFAAEDSKSCKGLGVLLFATVDSLSISGLASIVYVHKSSFHGKNGDLESHLHPFAV